MAGSTVGRVRTDFPRAVQVLDHVWIPMSDGTRLSARIWLPDDAVGDPVPAILEYIPYRKSDGTVLRDSQMHPYFAGHGYAAVRVDLRGSGDSEGLLADEYLTQEHDDALDVLAWLAQQPWCTGRVGMIGKSWGGFNALQIAARRPPQLGAVITVCSTDDRYADDVHYLGGSVLAAKMLPWAATMLAFNALPPDPAVVGDSWRRMWLERLEHNVPFVEAWLTHQRRDAYWQHGSVCEDYAAITCPVYAVGGWADAYTNAIPRLLAGLSCPRKGLIGPWGHQYPQSGVPGPRIGFLAECLRWWDHWLKGVDTGIADEPMLRAWMQEWVPPRPSCPDRPGRWVTEPAWPPPAAERRGYTLDAGRLRPEPVTGQPAESGQPDQPAELGQPGQPERVDIGVGALCGLAAGEWCPSGGTADLPLDQRAEDASSACFDTAPFPGPVEILGFCEATLTLVTDRPCGAVTVRLCDVAPDGESLLVTRGTLNLSHATGHEHPRPPRPGVPMTVTVRMNAIGQVIPAGHRLRLAVSSSYWPWVWPAPEPVSLGLLTGGRSRVELPVRASGRDDAPPAPFGPPEISAGAAVVSHPGRYDGERVVRRDLGTGRVDLVRTSDGGSRLVASGLEQARTRVETCSLVEGDPLSASVRCQSTTRLARGDWLIRVETDTVMTCDADNYRVTSAVDAFEGDVRVSATARSFTVPRDHT